MPPRQARGQPLHPIYPQGLAAGRARITDEEWVAMGGELSDDECSARLKRHFGIDL